MSKDQEVCASSLNEELEKEALSDATKECPDCAETIKFKAKKCRFCGYVYTELTGHENSLNVQQKKIWLVM